MGAQAEADLTAGELFGERPAGWDLPRAGRLTMTVPAGFDLRRVATSHGWSGLAPSCWDGRALHRTLALPDAGAVTVSVSPPTSTSVSAGLRVTWGRPVPGADRTSIRRDLRRMLSLDAGLTELWAVAPPWLAERGMGRLLRSPTVWEDLARTLATTNCSWALTRIMCRHLCQVLGEAGPHGERAFPTPAAVAGATEELLRTEVRVGYRARAFVELATAVADGTLDPERWLDPTLPDDVVQAELLALRGFGPYAAEGMLGLLGRPKGFALDSWIRAKLPRLLGREAMTDDEIRQRYAAAGRWGGTVLWCELTRDW